MLLLLFAASLSVWFPRYPHLFPASIANSIIFPFAVPIGAAFAHWHPGHFLTAVLAKVRNAPSVRTLPTTVSGKGHPHPAACTLRRVILPHFPFCHLPSTYLHHIAPALRRPFQIVLANPFRCTFTINSVKFRLRLAYIFISNGAGRAIRHFWTNAGF